MTNKNKDLPGNSVEFQRENRVHIAGEHGSVIRDLFNDFGPTAIQIHSDRWGERTAVQGCSSAVERPVHIGKAEGSTPSTPTGRAAPYNRGSPKTRQFYKVRPGNLEAYFWNNVAVGAPAHCWPWKGSLCEDGYGRARYDGKTWIASRLAYLVSYGEHPGQALICHHCDNPACCNPGHLYAGTKSDNEKDKFRRGRASMKGESNRSAKLTADKVSEIRNLFAQGKSNMEIGRLLGVHHSTISKIRTGASWRALYPQNWEPSSK